MNLDLYDEVSLERIQVEGDRYYRLPKSKVLVPSVTTVLYDGVDFPDTPYMRKARIRGEIIHNIIEDYLRHGKLQKMAMPTDRETFLKFKPVIDEYLSTVNLVEGRVYSHHLLTAGTIDCLGVWNGDLAVIDWKTSTRPKKEEHVEKYKLQAAVYSWCVQEVYGKGPKKAVIVVANDEEPKPQIFEYDMYDPMSMLEVETVFVTNRR